MHMHGVNTLVYLDFGVSVINHGQANTLCIVGRKDLGTISKRITVWIWTLTGVHWRPR